MNLFRKEGRRRRLPVVAFAGTLFAFQALAIIGAQVAAAAVTCTFSGGVISVTLSADLDTVEAQVQDTGRILMLGAADDTCGGIALLTNTTAINITGGAGDQDVTIDLFDNTGAGVDWGTINWTITLGADGAAGDSLTVDNSGSDTAVTQDWGASGVDLNGDGNLDATLSGIENFTALASDEGDTINAGGSTAAGATFADDITITGGLGDDTLTGGAGDDTIDGVAGADVVAGGLGDDALDGGTLGDGATVDYSGSAAAVTVNLNTTATGQGLDTLADFDNVIGSPQGDTLNGDAGDNVITGGAGDDKIDGKAGEDEADYSDSAAAVTVDLDAGTATGNGNDTLTAIEDVQGSDFADTLGGDDGSNGLFGGPGNDTIAGLGGDDEIKGEGGVDAVDYSWSTDPVTVLLSCDSTVAGDGDVSGTTVDDLFTVENAILTADDDSFTGNQFANRVWPNGGQNSLDGDGGKTCLTTPGGDTLDYSVGYTTGVNVNMAGGATAGDSAVNFENAIGTAFADTIVGNASSNTVQGRAGKDNLKGGSGDDVLRGAKGNDIVRGGSGDDDMFGGPGKKDRGFGGSGTDLCKGFEFKRGCELK